MIYFLRHIETGLIKIGVTDNLAQRKRYLELQFGDLELLGLVAGYEPEETELHNQFHKHHDRFTFGGREWFRPADEITDYIAKYASMTIPLPLGKRTGRHGTRFKKPTIVVKLPDDIMRIIDYVKIMSPRGTSRADVVHAALKHCYPEHYQK